MGMDMNPSITYAITACTEHWELGRLLELLQEYAQTDDQVLIQTDAENVTAKVLRVIDESRHYFTGQGVEYTHVSFPLGGDFSTFKNNLQKHSICDWIFQIDADEVPMPSLLMNLQYILRENEDVDVIRVPRLNTVHNITSDHIQKWGWRISKIDNPILRDHNNLDKITDGFYEILKAGDFIINETETDISYYHPIVNFPDHQWRLYQNNDAIQWENKVHEKLVGYKSFAELPSNPTYCLYHPKTIERQEYQNDFYSTIR